MKVLGIQWAPLNVPLTRRIQTAMALFWIISCAFGGFICYFLFGYLLFFTNYTTLASLYLIWMYYDRDVSLKGGRRSNFIRNLSCWKYYMDYFPLKLVRTKELSTKNNYMFCVFPHGVLSAGAFGHFGNNLSEFPKLFPNLTIYNATLDMHFSTPFFREYLLSLGAVSASEPGLTHVLDSTTKGKIVTLVVGGAAESLYAHPGTYRIILNSRKGFVRIALKTGTHLVPVFSFGETDLYSQAHNPPGSWLHKAQTYLRKHIGMAPCIFTGRGILQYSFGLIPRRHPVFTVVGPPIEVPQIEHPTKEDIEKYHLMFVEQLKELFNKHKHEYIANPDKTELIID